MRREPDRLREARVRLQAELEQLSLREYKGILDVLFFLTVLKTFDNMFA